MRLQKIRCTERNVLYKETKNAQNQLDNQKTGATS